MAAGVVLTSRLAVLAVVHEVLADCSTSHGGDELQRGGVGSGSGNDDGVLESAMLLERLTDCGDRRGLLANGDVDANHVLVLLVDDRVDADSGLTSLTVANDELTLAAANRDHRVDSEQAGLNGLANTLTGHNAGSLELDGAIALDLNGAHTVDRLAKRVDDAAEHGTGNRNLKDAAGRMDLVAFLDDSDVAQKNGANLFLFQVLGKAVDLLASAGAHELEELAGHSVLQTLNTGDAVADLDNRTNLTRINRGVQRIELLLKGSLDVRSGNFRHYSSPPVDAVLSTWRAWLSCVLTLASIRLP